MSFNKSLTTIFITIIALSTTQAETKNISNTATIELLDHKSHRLSAKTNKISFIDDFASASSASGYLHPALGDNGNGYLLKGYEKTDVIPEEILYWSGSDDNGGSWISPCYVDLYGSMYPSADYSGDSTLFYGTYVAPSTFHSGGSFILMTFPDPTDCFTWDGVWSDWSYYGWHSMKMVEIAADNSQLSWNWGFQSAILSRNYPSDTTRNLYDGPHIFHQIDNAGYTMIDYHLDIDSCRTTSCDIDPISEQTYAVFDRLDMNRNQGVLFLRQDFFSDWDSTGKCVNIFFNDSTQHMSYPVISSYDSNIIIVTSSYNDSLPENHDIICWYTDDADIDNIIDMSIVVESSESENYPEISHVSGNTFVCTYVSNNILYASRTPDGGINWSPPEQVSDTDHLVVEEYRTADIGDGGHKVIYEYQFEGNEAVYLAVRSLVSLDSDSDGIFFYDDNCPSTANPAQNNSDSDHFGDACDNCPSVDNPMQADNDLDGIGDICDDCPNDPLNDTDGDTICDSDDNCLDYNNPLQEDDDSDGVGDACDNCPLISNIDQLDYDEDGEGNLCDTCTDIDGDGYGDPGYPENTCVEDNCPPVYNPNQTDSNFDGIGDSCEYNCGDPNNDTSINLLDATYLISFLYKGGPRPFPVDKAGDVNNSGDVNLLDVTYLISYLYKGGPAPFCS